MLVEETLFGVVDKVEKSIARLKEFEPEDGYYLAFSGGKDSCVIKYLADMAGVKYDAHYSMTTIDPPELVKFIRQHHTDVAIDRPKESFFQILPRKGFPQRQRRWCCELLKEHGGGGRRVITGVRWDESPRRALRQSIEKCFKDRTKTYIHAIIEWTDSDVWQLIKENNIPYCTLYNEGWNRIGCLFCPMAGKHRMVELKRYPKFEEAFRRAFRELHKNKKLKPGCTSVDRWADGDAMFDWWVRDDRSSADDPDQCMMFD